MRKRKLKARLIATSCICIILILGWFSFGPPISGQAANTKVVTVGLSSPSKGESAIWHSVAQTAKKKYNITIKIKTFTDYNTPNKALKNGEIDLNSYQHYAFLNQWNKTNGNAIVPIAKTYIAPNRVFSKKYKSLNQLPDGTTIAVANDATNESRALFVLKNAGLIKLKRNTVLATVNDISANPRHLKIKELEAAQTARVISSVDATIVNNDFVEPAGLTAKETIYTEPLNKDSEKWISVIAAKKGSQHKKIYREVVKAYQTAKTKQLFRKYFGKSQIPAWDTTLK